MPSYSTMRALLATAALLAGTVAFAAKQPQFRPKSATKYPAKQTQGDVTVAVKPYHTEKLQKEAFGKAKPYKYGVLPVLVVITNKGDAVIGLEDLKVRYINSRREGIEPISAEDLAFFNPNGHQPTQKPSYIPGIPGVGRPKVKKGPLAKSEITSRAFVAPVLTPQSSVAGFFYYHVGDEENPAKESAMYLSGLTDMQAGRELFYFEIALDPYD